MAEGTRYKALEDQIKKTELKMQELASEWRRHSDENEASMEALMDLKIEKLDSKIDAYAASIESKLSGIYNFLSKEKFGNLDADRSPLLPNPATDAKSSEAKSLVGENSSVSEKWPKWGRQSHTYHWSYPKLELQSFSGENPREWLRKCNKFFEIHHCEESEKMEAVDLYLDGKADVWYQSFRLIKGLDGIFRSVVEAVW